MKKFNWMLVVVMMLFSFYAYAAEPPVDVYMGVTQTHVQMYGEDGDLTGGVVGFWMDDRAGLEFSYLEKDEFSMYEVQLLGSIVHGYMQRLTWQLGGNYVRAEALGIEDTDSFWHYGIGYEFQPFKALTLRAQYNRYEIGDDNATNKPDGVQLSVLYNF